MTGGVVLTAENPNKAGPLKQASNEGGVVINLRDFSHHALSFREFIIKKLDSTI